MAAKPTLIEQIASLSNHYGFLPRIVICEPARAADVQKLIDSYDGLGEFWTVRPSVLCPPDRLYLLDGIELRKAIFDGYDDTSRTLAYPPQENS